MDPCDPQPPTIQLDPKGTGPTVFFNVDQRICLPFTIPLEFELDTKCLAAEHTKAPELHWWNTVPSMSDDELDAYVEREFAPWLDQESRILDDVRYSAMLANEGRGGAIRVGGRKPGANQAGEGKG